MESLSWADRVLGRPFRKRARGPECFDCLGLVLSYVRSVLGAELEDPIVGGLPAVRRFRSSFVEVDQPAPGRFLQFRAERRWTEQHFAICESDRWAIEAVEGAFVQRTRLHELLEKDPRVWEFAP